MKSLKYIISLLSILIYSQINAQGIDAGVSAFLDPQVPTNSRALIEVTLKNFGTDTLRNVDIYTSINGFIKNPYRYKGPALAPQKSIDLYISGHNFNSNATYQMQLYTSNPNNVMDNNPANDTFNFTLKGELDLDNNDAGIVSILQPSSPLSPGHKLIRVKLKNFGTEPIENVTIAWRVNGVEQTPYQYIGPLLRTRREIDLYIGRYNFQAGQNYTISARTIMPNGINDERTTNDRAVKEYE